LTAVKLGIKVAHVEAGLRSFDRSMLEEINRILTDAISDYLFVSEESGVKNLKREGIPDKKIFFCW
jgi:UDP-N-acetylglucosamine 2-epimerase (non-hydrolysing)